MENVQPAGSAGGRHVFVTVSGDADTNKEVHIELVVRERAANNLADALMSGNRCRNSFRQFRNTRPSVSAKRFVAGL